MPQWLTCHSDHPMPTQGHFSETFLYRKEIIGYALKLFGIMV